MQVRHHIGDSVILLADVPIRLHFEYQGGRVIGCEITTNVGSAWARCPLHKFPEYAHLPKPAATNRASADQLLRKPANRRSLSIIWAHRSTFCLITRRPRRTVVYVVHPLDSLVYAFRFAATTVARNAAPPFAARSSALNWWERPIAISGGLHGDS